ncbi:MAG TPA: cupin domain-containing protein [Stellaceae bacterium]|nr:cupin domain-containing protein [Stellaceae bacterium]
METMITARRDLLITPWLAALPAATASMTAHAAVDPTMTIVKPPEEIKWSTGGAPPMSVEQAPLWGSVNEPGLYYTLVKWHPGYMSAPHWYVTDRYCVVVSGTWWVGSGENFDPESTVPAPAGSFVRRVARTPHYDGVKRDGKEAAVIAICGIAPVEYHQVDESQPRWRKV